MIEKHMFEHNTEILSASVQGAAILMRPEFQIQSINV